MFLSLPSRLRSCGHLHWDHPRGISRFSRQQVTSFPYCFSSVSHRHSIANNCLEGKGYCYIHLTKELEAQGLLLDQAYTDNKFLTSAILPF